MRVTFVTAGLEHLGIEALAAYLRAHGHDVALVYEPRPFSSGSGTDVALLAKLLDPPPERTAERVAATAPDVVAFSSYSVTHRWCVDVARAVKRRLAVPIVFGGQHVGAAPERAILEPAIDAVVEGEGEGALLDLVACAERDRFGRRDVPNCTFKGKLTPVKNPPRPLIADLDTLPFADKSLFYAVVPAYEREYYVISRRGCPFRCSFCEYSTFPRVYPGEKPVRRRSVRHLMDELRPLRARGVTRKVFFWDAIFTLDARWMAEFAEAYAAEVGIPFECYTHPQTMTAEMARLLAAAGCTMVRIGVQTVNSDTLAAVDRRGDEARVRQTVEHLDHHGVAYSIDHILGLPGEGASDQLAALRFYNEVRPKRIVTHWMTYFPGTTALEHARERGLLTDEDVARIHDGDVGAGYMFGGNVPYADGPALRHLSGVFDLLPLLPRDAVDWLLEGERWRFVPATGAMRQIGALALAARGEPATREHMRHVFATVLGAVTAAMRERVARA